MHWTNGRVSAGRPKRGVRAAGLCAWLNVPRPVCALRKLCTQREKMVALRYRGLAVRSREGGSRGTD